MIGHRNLETVKLLYSIIRHWKERSVQEAFLVIDAVNQTHIYTKLQSSHNALTVIKT